MHGVWEGSLEILLLTDLTDEVIGEHVVPRKFVEGVVQDVVTAFGSEWVAEVLCVKVNLTMRDGMIAHVAPWAHPLVGVGNVDGTVREEKQNSRLFQWTGAALTLCELETSLLERLCAYRVPFVASQT